MPDSILIVDDERGIRETLRGVLEDEGFAAEAVASGEECLKAVERRTYGCGEALADDAQGEALVALGAQDEPQTGDVVLGELAVAGGRAVGLDQAGALEEADLGDGDVRELRLEDPQHLADAHGRSGAGRLGPLAGAGGVSSIAARPGRQVALDRIPHDPTRHLRVDCRRRTPA